MKAQVAMEYVIVVFMVALLIIPAVYLIYSFSKSSETELMQSQVNKIGNEIVRTAEKVYYQGAPSRIVLDESMPEGVTLIKIEKDWDLNQNELVFDTYFGSKSSQFSFPSKVNIAGSFPPESYAGGLKKIRIEAVENTTPYVMISIT